MGTRTLVLAGLSCVFTAALADGALVASRELSLNLARTVADATLEACRKEGYQVAVVVTDRRGEPLVVLRDDLADRHFVRLAQGKANAVVLSGTSSGALAENRPEMVDVLNLFDDLRVLAGGLPLQAAGSLAGAVAVSGAPGGDIDERCARAGVDAVVEELEFAD